LFYYSVQTHNNELPEGKGNLLSKLLAIPKGKYFWLYFLPNDIKAPTLSLSLLLGYYISVKNFKSFVSAGEWKFYLKGKRPFFTTFY
jgi:hypothetical protein